MIPTGRAFVKMSGSGNDFVMVDARHDPPRQLSDPATVAAICARGTGIGADGIVFLESSDRADVGLTYLNADGSRADLCGNATLCTTRLSVELGGGDPAGMVIQTDSGLVDARILADGRPEIDLQAVADVQPTAGAIARAPGERELGFALAGVPHLVIVVDDVDTVDVVGRGRPLRSHVSLSAGANVNFVSPGDGGSWRVRTYERGVEGETLACGTGAVATGILLGVWGLTGPTVSLQTRSGKILRVRVERVSAGWRPSLSGEATIVFTGTLGEL